MQGGRRDGEGVERRGGGGGGQGGATIAWLWLPSVVKRQQAYVMMRELLENYCSSILKGKVRK